MAATALSGLDTAFLSLDSTSSPMNIGALALFAPPQPVHPARLAELLRTRAERIPRLRQRVRGSLLPLGVVRWVDDPRFDAAAHIHQHHLPRPHDTAQLTDRVADIMGERLDPGRPLWEIHVLTGLPGGRFAILPKLHHALADGAGAVLLGLSLLDGIDGRLASRRRPAPTSGGPAANGLGAGMRSLGLGEGLRSLGLGEGLRSLGSSAQQAMDIAGSVLRSARPTPPPSPLLAPTSSDRRLATVRLELADVKRVRRAHGGTTNDVLLSVLAGALREWLIARGDRTFTPRALIPVSQRGRDRGVAGNQLSGYLCDLPADEADPVRRLAAVRATMDGNKEAGPGRGPGALPVLADRVPAAVHRLMMPVFGQCASLLCDTVVTSVPLPNVPLFFDEAQLQEVYPVVPLAPGHALGVAFSTYRDTVHVGLHANGTALPDIDLLAEAFTGTLGYLNQMCA
ncbi:MAG TPA: wax ester/triacylglycerol synthase family O-acyltransferase [Pseudonocardiaceae bacterium]|jgi:WS/DGAT/MGAT family acyltransferase|nr:wax ester/triacylglycerol synthase family O-acyltransferase [Pseudonocardiaceae bacterium]